MEGLRKDKTFKRPTNPPYPIGRLLPPYRRPEWGPIPFPPPPTPVCTTRLWGQAGQGYCYPPPPLLPQSDHLMINQHWEQGGSSPQPRKPLYHPPTQVPNKMYQDHGHSQRHYQPYPHSQQNFAQDDLRRKDSTPPQPPPPPPQPDTISEMDRWTNYSTVKRSRLTNPPYPQRSTNWRPAKGGQIRSPARPRPRPRPPQPDTTPKDDPYYSFFEVMVPSVRSRLQLSDANLNEIARNALEVMARYKGRITMFEFLNKLLKKQESLDEDESIKRVTVLRIFVRLLRGLNLETQPPKEVKKMSDFFAELFNKTVEKIRTSRYLVAMRMPHLKVLESIKAECIQIGFDATQLAESDNFLGTTKLSSQRDVVSPPPSAPIIDVGAQGPVQVPGKKEKEAVSASLPKKHAISTSTSMDSISKVKTEGKIFMNFKLQLDSFRIKLKPGDALEGMDLQNLVNSLIEIFIKSRDSDPLHNDKNYICPVLENPKCLNNKGKKIMLWILIRILKKSASPQSFSRVEAKKLQRLVKNMNIQQCNNEWDTIEFLALKRRLNKYLDDNDVLPIEALITSLTVGKYTIDTDYRVIKLKLLDFYPRDEPELKKVSKKVLRKIPTSKGGLGTHLTTT